MKIREADYLIVGAGIVGLTIARELLERGADRIIILEKEPGLGFHASGRNSGVLHAGIYYPPKTLKAKLCLQGNKLLQAYCRENNLPLINSGKVIVARDESELPTLQQLYHRAQENGVRVEMVDEQQLIELEPNAKTIKHALYSHDTALVDNKAILAQLRQDLLKTKKVEIIFNSKLKSLKNDFTALTSTETIKFKHFINCAGAHADKVAHCFGVGSEYYFIPFKGIYHKLHPEYAHLVNGNIYPVPNLNNPFLGVHFTKSIHGDVYIGPTAIPAFGRENYGMLQGIDREVFNIIFNEAKLFCVNAQFRRVACEEPKKYFSSYFFRDAKKLVKSLEPDWLARTTKVGIRPQLINLNTKKLEMDFLVVKEKHSLHILNAISPAFTSSMAFAKHILDDYI